MGRMEQRARAQSCQSGTMHDQPLRLHDQPEGASSGTMRPAFVRRSSDKRLMAASMLSPQSDSTEITVCESMSNATGVRNACAGNGMRVPA